MKAAVLGWAVAALLVMPVRAAPAATAHGTISVRASVAGNCELTAPSELDFGLYDPTSNSGPLDVTSNVFAISCTRDASTEAVVALGNGLHFTGAHRAMLGSSGALIEYDVYTTAARSAVWSSSTTVTFHLVGRQSTEIPLYGRILAGQAVKAGRYSDTLQATVNF